VSGDKKSSSKIPPVPPLPKILGNEDDEEKEKSEGEWTTFKNSESSTSLAAKAHI
jgi:hypothetical protein